MDKGKLNKTIASFMVGGLILSSGVTGAFAQTTTKKAATTTTKKTATTAKTNVSKINSGLQTQLDALVKKGTINKAQEAKVLTALSKRTNMKRGQNGQNRQNGQSNNFQNMTDAQKKAFMQNRAKQRPNLLADLVKAKTITQAQSDAINKIIAASRGGFRMGNRNTNTPPSN
jgi:polyhydroxyalkanoate synthesis regulator phasin